MFSKTNMSYGVNEVLLASVLGAVVFAIAAAQPLVIVGVTGELVLPNRFIRDLFAAQVQLRCSITQCMIS